MNRIPLYRKREPWATGVAALLGLLVIAALVAWLWRPSKTVQGVPAPLAASAPVPQGAADADAAPAQARRQLALSGQWSRLSARDQVILAPLQEDWAELSTDQRLKWLDLSMRFPSLAPDEQFRVQERMAQWARLSSAERGAARLNFQELRQISQKERLEQWEAYQGLNPDEKKELAVKAQAAAQSPAVPRRSDSSAPVPKSSGGVAETVAGSPGVARPVSGTLVQAPIGATTRLVTQMPQTAAGTAPAGPKIAAQAGSVDPVTLLPQARSVRAPSAGEGTPAPGDEPIAPAGTEPTPAPPAGTGPTGPSGHSLPPGPIPTGGTP